MLFCDAVRLQNSILCIELLEIQLKIYAIFADADMAQARPREWILGRSPYAILWKTLTTSSSASRRSMRPLTSSCSSGESSRIVRGMRSNLNDLIS